MRPTQTNKTNKSLFDTNKQEHQIKRSRQVEQIHVLQEQTKRQELQKEVLSHHVDIQEDLKKQEFLL